MISIILAGGKGTRLRKTVPDLPKPMAPIGEKPFLAHLVDYWITQGIDHFILAVGYKHHLIEEYFKSEYHNTRITYSVEDNLLGTGGGLFQALNCLEGENTIVVLNGDTYFEVALDRLIGEHRNAGADLTIALSEKDNSGRYGCVDMDSNNLIKNISSHGDGSRSGYVNGGTYIVEINKLPKIEFSQGLSLEEDILPKMLKNKSRICGSLQPGNFIDIGIPEDYFKAREIMGGITGG